MNSPKTIYMVISVLGLLALSVVIGGIVLTLNDKDLSGELIAIGSAAAGAIAGILSKTGTDPQPVVVHQPANDPVPVAEH